MILADTCIWVEHFRSGNNDLSKHLNTASLCIHPFIIGELACGNLKNRTDILGMLEALPKTRNPGNSEILGFIEERNLMGKGLGYVDIHLLASSLLSTTPLWTNDKRLLEAARILGTSYI